ncbi:MAG: hypothetical protein KIH64_001250 [Mycobacterium sp.]|nr:hypothetical protein [Mycobacterium sp.]
MRLQFAAGIGTVLVLAACSSQTKPVADATASPASSPSATSASPAPATPVAGGKPSRDFVIGKWGTDGDCGMAIDLRSDGTSDGPFGNWTYTDGVIGFTDEPDFKVSVTVIDDNTMESTNDSTDKKSKMTRCP